MGVLSAKEKLMILASGKATLKQINDLEAMAEEELANIDKQDKLTNENLTPEPKPEPTPETKPEPKPEPTPEPKPDEKDLKIAELEKQIEAIQKENVNADNSGSVTDNDTALLNIFKTFR